MTEKKFVLSRHNRDLTGQRFGRLVALRPVGKDKNLHNVLWKCKCDCGQECIVRGYNLVSGNTKSCGCLRRPHGMWNSRTYKSWQAMLQRCENPKCESFPRYGGRGIKVCDSWHKFENFLEDMGEAPDNLTIERIDNEAGYHSANCKWATMKEQSNNRRPISYGKTKQLWFLGFDTRTGKFDEDNNQHVFARRHGLDSRRISDCLCKRISQTYGWEFDYLPFQQ